MVTERAASGTTSSSARSSPPSSSAPAPSTWPVGVARPRPCPRRRGVPLRPRMVPVAPRSPCDGSLEELGPGRRAAVAAWHGCSRFSCAAAGVKFVKDVGSPGSPARCCRLDVTGPDGPEPGGRAKRPRSLQIHGGGWVIGDKREQGLPLLSHLAAEGWVGFNANYRLSPEATFPDHLVDCKRAWRGSASTPTSTAATPTSSASPAARPAATSPRSWRSRRTTRGTSPASRTPTRRSRPRVPFYGVYDFTPRRRSARPRDLPAVPRADGDEGVPRRRARALRGGLAAGPGPRRRAAVLRHPRRPRHARPGRRRPARSSSGSARCRREPVLYVELRGAQHAFDMFPSVRTGNVVAGSGPVPHHALGAARGADRRPSRRELEDTLTAD